jgi:hypothetical protein
MKLRVASTGAQTISAAEAAAFVSSGMWLDYGTGVGQPGRDPRHLPGDVGDHEDDPHHREHGHGDGQEHRRLAVVGIDLTQRIGAIGQMAHQSARPFGKVAGPAKHGGHQLSLVPAETEIPLVLHDRLANAPHRYLPSAKDLQLGWYGDEVLVNFTPRPYLDVTGRRYRFRVLNASNARNFRLAFRRDDGAPMPIVALPAASVLRYASRDWVYVEVSAGHFARRAVTLARTDGDSVLIAAGVDANAQVVTAGAMALLSTEQLAAGGGSGE